MRTPSVLTAVLLVLGGGFLLANARLLLMYLTYLRRRRFALLTWRPPRPPYYAVTMALGVALALLVITKVFLLHPSQPVFGEGMMFVYYACLLPLSRRIARGFYEDGIWADSAFIPYSDVGGISWREGDHQVTLIVSSRLRKLARRLIVPGDKYGAARRLLRDKIGQHEIHFTGTGLDLGAHDERDEA